MTSSLAQDADLLREFFAECDELLQRADQDLVRLEREGVTPDLLNAIFRVFHTIKGTSGFMGLDDVVTLTHHAEDVLNILRQRTTPLDSTTFRETMDVLLCAHDQLGRMINMLRGGTIAEVPIEPIVARLTALRGSLEQERPRLGEIMVVEHVISPSELDESLAEAAYEGRKLGEVLVDKKFASAAQVEEALGMQAGRQATGANEAAQTIRVGTAKLDDLLNLVGELVLERNRLQRLNADLRNGNLSSEKFAEALDDSSGRLSAITDELQSASLRTRMVPIDSAFRRFPRLVRDISRTLGKEVDLEISGEDTELDKNMVEHIGDPLVHLVRNALDHGIELPDVRELWGKSRKGTIRIGAKQEADHIVISVSDDGAGMDADRIGQLAVTKGLITPERLAGMNEKEILNLIFFPGFSTASSITDISGRGVGMDVVRSNIERINGVVEVESFPGKGSAIRLRLPLTLAIMPMLLVGVGNETFALPLRSVEEIVRIPRSETHKLGSSLGNVEMFRLRERVIPLRYISGVTNAPAGTDITVIVLGHDERRMGIVVDRLLGQEETVVKPLGKYLGHVPGISGATISGDGHVRLILDPAALV